MRGVAKHAWFIIASLSLSLIMLPASLGMRLKNRHSLATQNNMRWCQGRKDICLMAWGRVLLETGTGDGGQLSPVPWWPRWTWTTQTNTGRRTNTSTNPDKGPGVVASRKFYYRELRWWKLLQVVVRFNKGFIKYILFVLRPPSQSTLPGISDGISCWSAHNSTEFFCKSVVVWLRYPRNMVIFCTE